MRSRSRFRRRAFYELSISTIYSPAAIARNNAIHISTSGTTLIGVVASACVVVTTTCVPASSRGRATVVTTVCSATSSGSGTVIGTSVLITSCGILIVSGILIGLVSVLGLVNFLAVFVQRLANYDAQLSGPHIALSFLSSNNFILGGSAQEHNVCSALVAHVGCGGRVVSQESASYSDYTLASANRSDVAILINRSDSLIAGCPGQGLGVNILRNDNAGILHRLKSVHTIGVHCNLGRLDFLFRSSNGDVAGSAQLSLLGFGGQSNIRFASLNRSHIAFSVNRGHLFVAGYPCELQALSSLLNIFLFGFAGLKSHIQLHGLARDHIHLFGKANLFDIDASARGQCRSHANCNYHRNNLLEFHLKSSC